MRTPIPAGTVLKDAAGKQADLLVDSGRLVEGRIKVLDKQTWTERFEPYEDLRQRIAQGTLIVERPEQPALRTQALMSKADEQALADAALILGELRARMTQFEVSASRAYGILCEERSEAPQDQPSKPLPSKSSVFRWLARDAKGLPLLTASAAKGNRTHRHSDALCEFILARANLYLDPKSRWSLRRFALDMTQQAHDAGHLDKSAGLSRQFVKDLLHDNGFTDPKKARMNPKDRASGRSIAKHTIRLAMPMQRVEQDALHLPYVVRTPAGISSTIYLVHAIDCYTSIPVGWLLVIGMPVASNSLDCTERIFFPKAPLLEKIGVNAGVDLYGLVGTLIFDNGPENKGERMVSLARLGLLPMHCKSRHAHGKPFIERLNLSLKRALETLPGCTRMDDKDGMRDPVAQGDELMDIEELERWVVRWYYEKWIHTKLERLEHRIFVDDFAGFTPAEVYKKRVIDEDWAMPLPPNRRDFDMLRFERESCTLSLKTGITTRGFNFGGHNLTRLINEHGEKVVTVLVDPDDFRYVQVLSGDQTELVQLVNKSITADTPAHSFAQAKALLTEQRKRGAIDEPEQSIQFDRDVFKRSAGDVKPPSAASPKRLTRDTSKQTTKRAKHEAAVERAVLVPLLEPVSVALSSASPADVVWSVQPPGLFTVVDQSAKDADGKPSR